MCTQLPDQRYHSPPAIPLQRYGASVNALRCIPWCSAPRESVIPRCGVASPILNSVCFPTFVEVISRPFPSTQTISCWRVTIRQISALSRAEAPLQHVRLGGSAAILKQRIRHYIMAVRNYLPLWRKKPSWVVCGGSVFGRDAKAKPTGSIHGVFRNRPPMRARVVTARLLAFTRSVRPIRHDQLS
jgi:hypothetical protein